MIVRSWSSRDESVGSWRSSRIWMVGCWKVGTRMLGAGVLGPVVGSGWVGAGK
jgi:hypothetical protein